MRAKLVDLTLITVILGSVGFIGYRILDKRTPSQPDPTALLGKGPKTDAPALPSATPVLLLNPTGSYGVGTQAVFAQQPKLDLAVWSAALAKEKLVAVEASAKCQDKGFEPEPFYQILSSDLRDRLVANGGGVIVRYGAKKCQRKGQTLTLQYYGNSQDEAYVSNMGLYKIAEIVELDRDRVSNDLWSVLKTSREENRSPHSKMMLLRIERSGDAKPESNRPPTTHFRYKYLSEANLETTADIKKAADPIILDLRSAALQKSAPIANATPVEFKTEGSPLKGDAFRWDVKVADVEKTNIGMQPVMDLAKSADKSKAIIVVGAGETDGRPFWLLRSLSTLRFENVYWYNGSAEKLAAAIR